MPRLRLRVGLASLAAAVAACTSPPDDVAPRCTETCGSTGAQCGLVCGTSCGACPGLGVCVAGKCACTRQCEGRDCHADDGCGGTCGPCDADTSCLTCGLRLVRVDDRRVAGQLTRVDLAIESVGAPGAPLPSLADLRLVAEPPMDVERVELGAPLQEAGKRLWRFQGTNLPSRVLDDGALQLLVLTLGKTRPIEPGRLLVLHLARPAGASGDAWKKVAFHLVRRAETLAPADADDALQRSAYDAPLVVGGDGP